MKDSLSKKPKMKIIKGGAEKMANTVHVATMYSANTALQIDTEDTLLEDLKCSGQRLTAILNITDEDINIALKELRKECWK